MANEWYYAQGGQQFGPISADELQRLAAAGRLLPDDLVWKDGMPNWTPASRIKGLKLASPTAPPPPTGNVPAGTTAPTTSEPPVIRTTPFDTSQAAAAARQYGHQAKDAAMAAGADSFTAFKALVSNPVGGLKVAFENLGPTRAMIVGIVFGIVFDLCILIGVSSLFSGFVPPGSMPSRMDAEMSEPPEPGLGAGSLFKLVILGLVPLASATAGCAAARTVFRGKGSIQSDIFIAGSSLLPFGVAVFLMGIVGLANIEIVALLGIFAITTTILMMYSGCTSLQEIPDAAATLCVPLMIVADVYVCKIILMSVIGP